MKSPYYRLASPLRATPLAQFAFLVTLTALAGSESGVVLAAQPPAATPPATTSTAANRVALGVRLREADGGKVFISNVLPRGAADRAGVRAGDRILSIGDSKMAKVRDVLSAMDRQTAGKPLQISVERKGQTHQLTAQPATASRQRHQALIGIQMADEPEGLMVLQTYAGGPAEQAGVQPDDIITAVDTHTVANATQLLQLLRQHRPGEKIDLLVTRNGWRRNFVMTLQDRQEIAARAQAEAAASAARAQAQAAATVSDQANQSEGGFDPAVEGNVNLRALDTDFD